MEPFATLINRRLMLPSQKTSYIAVEMHFLARSFRHQTGEIWVDKEWYISKYQDVVEALAQGKIKNADEHYALYGYYEHRMPYEILVDEEWYIAQYDDIRKAVNAGDYVSGQAHFEELGYKEGRIPYPHFQLRMRGEGG